MSLRPWYKPIDKAAASQIVAQTRVLRCPEVDTELLTDDLNFLFHLVDGFRRNDIASSKEALKALEVFASRMTRIENDLLKSKQALALQTNLAWGGDRVGTTDDVYRAVGLEPPDEMPPFGDPRVELAIPRLVKAISLATRWARAAVDSPPGLRYSPMEILVGQGLPHFFEKHFGRQFGGGTAGDRGAEGPGIRFVLATLTAASITRPDGKKYSPETIRTYWQKSAYRRQREAPEKIPKKI
jgi:hypothetical protein